MEIKLENYQKIFHVPSYSFVKNDRRNKKLYVQQFSSEIIFKRSIETLKFSLKNKALSNQRSGKAREVYKIMSGMSINFNYSLDLIIYSPKIIFWDENKKLGFFEVITKKVI